MNNFTDEEIKVAKKVKDSLINGEMPDELKSVYMAGEICMWDELRQSPSTDVSALKEALQKIVALPGEWNEARQLARKALADFMYPGMGNEIKAQYSTLTAPAEKEGQLLWKEGKTLIFDWTILFSKSYNFEGLELMAQETLTPIGRIVIWPDRLGPNKKWSFYFEYDGWFKQDFNSEEDIKKAVQDAVKKELASQAKPPADEIDPSISEGEERRLNRQEDNNELLGKCLNMLRFLYMNEYCGDHGAEVRELITPKPHRKQ